MVSRALWSFVTAVSASPAGAGDELRSDADSQLDAAEKVAHATAPDVVIDRRVVEGHVVETYVRAAMGAALLVLDGSDDGPILHGHVPGIVAGAPCPVLVWRTAEASEGDASDSIVIGIDESPGSKAALEAGFAVADVLDAPITVAHMWETDAAVGLGYAAGPTDWQLVKVLRAEQESAIDALLAPMGEKYSRVATRIVAEDNSPAKGLVELSGTASMVVVGRDGRGRMAQALLGSVTQTVLHHAHCPVLVVPSDGSGL